MTKESSQQGPNSENKEVASSFDVRVEDAEGVIALSGDLEGTNDVRLKLCLALQAVTPRREWRIEAGDARVVPEGVEAWIQATRIYFRNCALSYGPSQLAMILQCDQTYEHPRTSFADVDLRDEIDR